MSVMAVSFATAQSLEEDRLGPLAILWQEAGLPTRVESVLARVMKAHTEIRKMRDMPQSADYPS